MSAHETTLLSCHSGFQEILLTEDARGLRTLRFGVEGASQSVVDPRDPRHLALPYARVVVASLGFVEHLQRVLIVGLGGGSLPRFLRFHFPEIGIEVVELDPKVHEIALQYCGLQEDARLRVHLEDGRDYVERSPGKYDLIMLDCFDAETIPAHLTTLDFLGHVRQTLSPGGVVAANIWGPAQNSLYASMVKTYRAAFDDLYILDVPGPATKIFLALPSRRTMSRPELLERLGSLAAERGFTFPLPKAVAGFRHGSAETIRGGSILRDAR